MFRLAGNSALGKIRIRRAIGDRLWSGHVRYNRSRTNLRRSKPKLDDGAGIGHQLCLPAIVSLELLHGGLGSCIPVTARLSHITGVNESLLNLGSALVVDRNAGRMFCGCFDLFR